jgi:tetratricopeptide (TPR) repeat protein
MNPLEKLTTHLRENRIVIFAGAAISMAPPSSLASWKGVNEIILQCLAERLSIFTGKEFSEDILRKLIETRDNSSHFAPDYQAQLIEDECGADYFRVLQALDSDNINSCHKAIALLAKYRKVSAIITTNFDRLIERALQKLSVPFKVYYRYNDYDSLYHEITGSESDVIPLIKVHGSVESPESMVDTLRQRLMRRPEKLEKTIQWLITNHHVLFTGFSGADLAYDKNYLGLFGAAEKNQGFTCLVRTGTVPSGEMKMLADSWRNSCAFISGTLPEFLADLVSKLGIAITLNDGDPGPGSAKDKLTSHAHAWADSLGHMICVAIMAELLESSGRSSLAFELLSKTLRSAAPERSVGEKGYERFNYQLGKRLLDLGKFDYEIDRVQGRKVKTEGHYSPFTANDCFQCLHRSLVSETFQDGSLAMGLYEFLWGMPQSAAERIRAVRDYASKVPKPYLFVDACCALAVVYEQLQQFSDSMEWLEAANRIVKLTGDEPRRARVMAELSRFYGWKQRFDEAYQCLEEGYAICDRLQIHAIRLHLLASEGSILVLQNQGEKALEKLDVAIKGYREARLNPPLLRAFIDVCYCYLMVDNIKAMATTFEEAKALSEKYLGYAPSIALLGCELSFRVGDYEMMKLFIQDTKNLGKAYQNEATVTSAEGWERKLLQRETGRKT